MLYGIIYRSLHLNSQDYSAVKGLIIAVLHMILRYVCKYWGLSHSIIVCKYWGLSHSIIVLLLYTCLFQNTDDSGSKIQLECCTELKKHNDVEYSEYLCVKFDDLNNKSEVKSVTKLNAVSSTFTALNYSYVPCT